MRGVADVVFIDPLITFESKIAVEVEVNVFVIAER
jgi:hypothetical protein